MIHAVHMRRCFVVILCAVGGLAVALAAIAGPVSDIPASEGVSHVPLTITGGHETDGRDRGRPVVLIAAALGVPDDVFRNAFRGVTPAPAGESPASGQVRRNKEALLRVLTPYGVTNERLDAASDFYRYNRSRGEMWKHSPAAGYATVHNGEIVSVTITSAGAGYSSPPAISIPQLPHAALTATLSFGKDLATNGNLRTITVTPPATMTAH